MKRFRLDPFLLGMAAAVALAWLFPEPGASGGWLQPERLNKAAIALIFFLHGCALPLAALKAGTLRWPAHLVIQGCTFGLFPVLGLLVWAVGGAADISPDLRLGLFFLCALPSTVSSSVALTAAARGDVAVAVFNASLSSLLGIVLTPLWLGLVLQASAHALPLGEVVGDLVRWLLAPFALGQVLRPLVGSWVQRHKAVVNRVDRGTILLLVYTSFCESVASGVWLRHGWGSVAAVATVCLALFFAAFVMVGAVGRAVGLGEKERIAAIFCGSKKTLASGVPMAQIIFAGHPGLGVILLPLMLYHPLQLMVSGWFAGRWAARPAL